MGYVESSRPLAHASGVKGERNSMKRMITIAAVCTLLVLSACSNAAQVITNGDFEAGSSGGTPTGWTKVTSTVYSCTGRTCDWQLFSSTLNNYPPLDPYAGTWSLGVYRVDGQRCVHSNPGLDFYEFNVLYQVIPVSPGSTYDVRASAAVFTHHHRMGDLEDFWGSGIAMRICNGSGVYADASAIWQHSFWNWEGESFWRYYPELKNQLSDGYGGALPNRITATGGSVTVSIIWLAKWDVEMDLCALDNVQLDLSPASGSPPAGSDNFNAKNPPTWSDPDPIWHPVQKTPHWPKPGATTGGDQFDQSTELTGGMRPICSAVGDLNGDGLQDIISVSQWSHLVSIYLQQPDNRFSAGAHLAGTIMPRCVQIGQVVGSSAPDLVVSSAGKQEVAVFPGNGDGTFASPYHVPTSLQPTYVALADFNLDSRMDFAVGGQRAGTSGNVEIWLGDGIGGFTLSQTISGLADISTPSYVLAGDLGSMDWPGMPDGKPDLAVLSWFGPLCTFAGLGDGTFFYMQSVSSGGGWKSTGLAAANFDEDASNLLDFCTTYMWGPGDSADHAQLMKGVGYCTYQGQSDWHDWLSTGRFPSSADALDYNYDGRPDIAICHYASADVAVFRNLGSTVDWSFQDIGHFGVGNTNLHVLARDVNADGYIDLVVASGGTQTTNVIYGGPGGEFGAPLSKHGITATAAAIADFVTADPKPDIALGSTDRVRVVRNDGDLQFATVYTDTGVIGKCVDLSAGDLNSDGAPDFVATFVPSSYPRCFVYRGDGAGGFLRGAYLMSYAPASDAGDLVLRDFDNATGLDLLVSEAASGHEGVYCRLNNGSGDFSAAFKRTVLPAGSLPRDLDAGDFDSDGKQDVVVALSALNQFALLTGKGDGYFNAPVTFNTGAEPSGICAADFNGDTKLDVAVANKGADTITIFLGNGAGSFAAGSTHAVGSQPSHVETHDLNADSKPDLVVANSGDTTFSYLRGNGDGTFQPQQTYRTASTPLRFAVGDLRGTGLPDLFATGQWEIFRNAALSPSLVRLAADAKVLDDGRQVMLAGQVVGRAWTASPWVCYVQNGDRTSGIRVEGAGTPPAAGTQVTVSGTMASSGPERMISATEVIQTGSPGEPMPLGLVQRALGGGDFEYDPGPPASGQSGVQGGSGTNNVGLLVRIAGTVTRSEAAEDYFCLDDGSALEVGGVLGVRCLAEGLTKPSSGSFVIVTGISGAFDLGAPTRCLRVRRQSDILP